MDSRCILSIALDRKILWESQKTRASAIHPQWKTQNKRFTAYSGHYYGPYPPNRGREAQPEGQASARSREEPGYFAEGWVDRRVGFRRMPRLAIAKRIGDATSVAFLFDK